MNSVFLSGNFLFAALAFVLVIVYFVNKGRNNRKFKR